MPKTPFFKIIIKKTGRDISDLISKISHEDAVDEDNLLVMHFSDTSFALIDDDDLKEGEIVTFQYGFTAGKSSPTYLARIIDVVSNYQDVVHTVIRATDLGIAMKKNSSKKIWQNITSSEIVKQLALANGLNAVVEDTEIVHKNMPQAGRSDYEFIKYLASREKDGSWRFYLKNDEVYFTRLKLEKESRRTLRWNDGNGIIKSFRPYSQESLKQAASRDTVITTVDPFTNQAIQNVVNNSTAKDDVKLGQYVYDFNSNQQAFKIEGQQSKFNLNANQRPSKIQAAQNDPSKTGKHVYTPVGNSTQSANVGNKIKKKSAMKDYMASLMTEGDPDFISDIVITMAGVAKKDTGNWYVSRVTHTVETQSGYLTRLTMSKNAGKKKIGDGTAQSNVNKTTGPDAAADQQNKKEVKLYYYDENGNEVKAPQ